MPSRAMDQKKSRVVAQMDEEPLIFPYDIFQHNTENRGGGQKKSRMRALFYFISSVLLKCSDRMFPENTQAHCL